MKLFTIGADPELFLVSIEGKKFISSVGKIGGSKESPQSIGNGCAVQEDNVAVEFNIPPSETLTQFQDSLQYSLEVLRNRALTLKCHLSITASATFTADQLKTPEALIFGCDPDYSAWTQEQNPRPTAKNQKLRSCGGHIHVGTDLNKVDVIRAMDLFLGCPSTVMDKDTKRRQLYGKAGAYRPKAYGCEYRTLSNFWIASTELIKWAYNQTAKAIEFVDTTSKEGLVEWEEEIGNAIQSCINKNDTDALIFLSGKYDLGI